MMLMIIFIYNSEVDVDIFTNNALDLRSIIFTFLPVLCVYGCYHIQLNQMNNKYIMYTLLSISLLVTIFSILDVKNKSFYMFLLFSISIALVLNYTLISNHLIGWDVHREYRYFNLIEQNKLWIKDINDRYNSVLSSNILPFILSIILNIDGVYIFKAVYPIMYSITPVILYILYDKTDIKYPFLSSFFFMSFNVYYTEMLQLGKQMMAEIFYILIFLTIFTKKITHNQKSYLLIFYIFSLVVSHYGIAYIFLFFISITFILSYISRKKISEIGVNIIFITIAITFSWYMYIGGGSSFVILQNVIFGTFISIFTEFFSLRSRESVVFMALGLIEDIPIFHVQGRMFFYITEFLIIVGFISILSKYFRKDTKLNYGLFYLHSLNMILLLASIILPRFSSFFNMTRIYHTVLIFLSPLLFEGLDLSIDFVLNIDVKKISKYIALVILIPLFLFQCGAIYEFVGEESWSPSLSRYRMEWRQTESLGISEETDISGVEWIRDHAYPQVMIVSDSYSRDVLLTGGYGMLGFNQTYALDIFVRWSKNLPQERLIYLRSFNVEEKLMAYYYTEYLELKEEIDYLDYNYNKIFTNGGNLVYR